MVEVSSHGIFAPSISPKISPAAPFLKWAGGKGRLLPQYTSCFPAKFKNYHEPFLGGGAVFFRLQPPSAFLSDSNAELIDCYRAIRDETNEVIAALGKHRHEKEHYYKVREQIPWELSRAERAARMIFLNRTCFNGLYRLNRQGRFNVPMGSYKNPKICPADRLLAASAALQGARLEHRSFEKVLDHARAGDFAYFDPPYFPLSPTSSFTSYDQEGFRKKEQEKLAEVMSELDRRGVLVMQSNSDCGYIRNLYQGFKMREALAARSINSVSTRRGRISELVITNY
jgi:DNA adenine methylase